jgi:hypothetical protein
VNAGRLLAPRTRLGIVARNAMFTAMSVVGPLVKVFDKPASNIDLPDYDAASLKSA